MHIAWHEWSPQTFARAEAEKKPVLLSLVTAWSDGCAAMDHGTYANPEVVSLVTRAFVPVRVDADRRPDVNDRYNIGGWPTTAFLTSSGQVLSGGTYLTAEQMMLALREVAEAYRSRAAEISARAVASRRDVLLQASPAVLESDPVATIAEFRSLVTDRFDPVHGGLGAAPKLPHPYALLFALAEERDSGDSSMGHLIDATLEGLDSLWDTIDGGFRRYADREDWSAAASEKTIEGNALLLHVYIEAAMTGRSVARHRAADIVQWVQRSMTVRESGGFCNAQFSAGVDRTLYVDRNGMMVGALMRSAAFFDDIWLRDFALAAIEAVVVPSYVPGEGVGHVPPDHHGGGVRGLLGDQIHAAAALIWAHAATGHLPYSMLATELAQFAVRTMWSDAIGVFRDRVDGDDPLIPFELNCHAACVLDRLATLTGDIGHHERAMSILRTLAGESRQHDLFAAPYALAVREVIDRRPPPGLELTYVEWDLRR